jgi:Tol biopolymer transport system component
MKPYSDLDVLVSRWLEATAPTREPEHLLDDVLASVGHTRRRPAWRIPERWIPMQTTLRWQPVPRLVPVVLVGLLIVALLAAALFVGSPRRLPLPTGLAANGQIAYASEGQLWLANADGTNPHAITSDALVNGVPHFSRDGTKIAYLTFGADPTAGRVHADGRASLIVADADGRNPVPIIEGVKWTRYVDFSPDAKWIAYSYFADNATTYQHDRIEIAPTDGSAKPVRIGDPDLGAFYPAFSPDGGRIAFLSDHYPDLCDQGDCYEEKSFGLHVMNADGTDATVLVHGTTQPLLAPAVDRWAPIVDWSPDGTHILFTGVDARKGAIPGLYVVDSKVGPQPSRVDTGPGLAYGATYSPAGDQIAYVREADAGWEAVVADVGGGNARVVATGISRFAPQWSPDGRSIAVVDPISGSTASVRIVPLDGQGPEHTIRLALDGPADDPLAPTLAGIDQISWQRLAP